MSDPLHQIKEKLQRNDLLGAFELCKKAVDKGSKDADIFWIGGQCALKLWHTSIAIDWISRALELSSQTADMLYHLGLSYRQAERFGDAASTFEKVLTFPDAPYDATHHLAECLTLENRFDEAIAWFERLLTTPDYRTLIGLNVCHLVQGNLEKAVECAVRASHISPNFEDVQARLEATLVQTAMKAAEAVDLVSVRRISRELARWNKNEQAEALFNFLLEVNPDSIEDISGLTDFLIKSSRIGEAADFLRARTVAYASNPVLGYTLIPDLLRLNLLGEARQIVDHAGEAAARDAQNLQMLARALPPDEGLSLLENVCTAHPDSFSLHEKLADLYRDRGNREAAEGHYEKALNCLLNQETEAAVRNAFLVRSCDRDELSRTQRLYDQLRSRQEASREAMAKFANLLYAKGRAQEAAVLQRDLADHYGSAPGSQLHHVLRSQDEQPLAYQDEAYARHLASPGDISLLRHLLDAPEEINRIVAVNFWGRSGSFLLSSLFDSHPEVLHVMPSHSMFDVAMIRFEFFDRFMEQCGSINGVVNAIVSDFRENQDGTVWSALKEEEAPRFAEALAYGLRGLQKRGFLNAGAMFRLVHIALALVQGKTYDRIPMILFQSHHGSTYYRRHLRKILPEIRFVSCVRYPPRTFDSHLYHHYYSRTICKPFQLAPLLFEWLIDMGEWDDQSDRVGTTTIVRFEDIHNHTEFMTRWLCNWLGMEWNSCLLDSTVGGSSWSMQGAQAVHQGTRQMTAKDFELQVLSRWDDLRIRTLFNQNMVEWGYIGEAEGKANASILDDSALQETLLSTPLALYATEIKRAVDQGLPAAEAAALFAESNSRLVELMKNELQRRKTTGARLLPMLYRDELAAHAGLSPFNGANLN